MYKNSCTQNLQNVDVRMSWVLVIHILVLKWPLASGQLWSDHQVRRQQLMNNNNNNNNSKCQLNKETKRTREPHNRHQQLLWLVSLAKYGNNILVYIQGLP